MNRIVLIFLLAVCVVFLTAGVAGAQNVSLELKGGTFMPSGDLDDDDWEDGFYGELAGTYRESNMGIQAAVGYYTTEFNDDYSHSSLGDVEEEDTLQVYPVTLSFLGFYENGPLHFYGGGGVGYYFASAEVEINPKGAGSKFSDSDRDSVFGYHVMAGLDYNVTANFFFGVEGRLVRTNEANFSLKDNGIEADYDAELNGNVIEAKIGFRF